MTQDEEFVIYFAVFLAMELQPAKCYLILDTICSLLDICYLLPDISFGLLLFDTLYFVPNKTKVESVKLEKAFDFEI